MPATILIQYPQGASLRLTWFSSPRDISFLPENSRLAARHLAIFQQQNVCSQLGQFGSVKKGRVILEFIWSSPHFVEFELDAFILNGRSVRLPSRPPNPESKGQPRDCSTSSCFRPAFSTRVVCLQPIHSPHNSSSYHPTYNHFAQ